MKDRTEQSSRKQVLRCIREQIAYRKAQISHLIKMSRPIAGGAFPS